MKDMKWMIPLALLCMGSSSLAGNKFYVYQKQGTSNSYNESTKTLINIKADNNGTTYALSAVQKIVINTPSETDKEGGTCILFSTGAWKNTSGVNQQTADPDDQVFVYPNPVKENLSIGGLTKGETVRLYNMNGVLVKEVNTIDNSLDMNVSDLNSGLFLLKIGNKVIKINKQ